MRALAHALHMVVAAAPVGDYHPIVSPLTIENIPQKMGILVCVHTVDPVVGSHDSLGMAFLHRDLKTGGVDLPKRPLIHHRVAGHAPLLLAVCHHGRLLLQRHLFYDMFVFQDPVLPFFPFLLF